MSASDLKLKTDPQGRASSRVSGNTNGAGLAQAWPDLRTSEIRYRRLFEAARDGILLVDPGTHQIIDVNPFMIELLGYKREGFLGKELWEIGLLKDKEASRQMFTELLEKHFVRYEDLPLKNVEGNPREVEVVANLYQEDSHGVIQCNIRDITERKRVEKELSVAREENGRYVSDLEKTIAEQTSQLRETIGELEAFSYSLSHDLRAPLRTMRSFTELLLANYSSQLDADGIHYLQRILASANHLDSLIQDVLNYTRILRADIKIERVDLEKLVRETIAVDPELQPRHAEIRIEGSLPPVQAAAASLEQCISNLLNNAVKFVAPGVKPEVRVRAERIGPDVRLWVEDNGIGIPAKDQTRIFKMLERASDPAVYEGTGIGLAVVQKAIERMGGQKGVESEPGKGSKFWIQLRAATE